MAKFTTALQTAKRRASETGTVYYVIQANNRKWMFETEKSKQTYDLKAKCYAVKPDGSIQRVQ